MNSISQFTSAPVTRAAMSELEARMKSAIVEGTAIDAVPHTRLEHGFIPGAYARQLWRPANTFIVGKIHKHACFNFLMSGRLFVWCESGAREIVAPSFWVSTGGRRVTFAVEDSLLITVHASAETDLDKLEDELIAKDYDDLLPDSYKQFLENKS